MQRRLVLLMSTLSVVHCADSERPPDPPVEPPFAEVESAGILQYLGLADPVDVSTLEDSTVYEWSTDDGPMCLRGDPYRMTVRETDASNDLLIFLGGGGACWSDFCFAFDAAGRAIPPMQALNPAEPANPFADFDVAYLHYCDGSLFGGDIEHDDDGDGESDRFQYGLKNLSVALDVVVERFPNPDRLILAGASGGGYGTIVATFLVRALYPNRELIVLNDSGVGIAKGADDPGFVDNLFQEFNATRWIPASCENCMANGHLTDLLAWQLSHDPQLTIVAMSFLQDQVIGTLFLQLEGAEYEAALRSEASRLLSEFPGRYVPFFLEGNAHTMLAGDLSVLLEDVPVDSPDLAQFIQLGGLEASTPEGVTASQWLRWMLDGDPRWTPQL